jgi:hypothetical protein
VASANPRIRKPFRWETPCVVHCSDAERGTGRGVFGWGQPSRWPAPAPFQRGSQDGRIPDNTLLPYYSGARGATTDEDDLVTMCSGCFNDGPRPACRESDSAPGFCHRSKNSSDRGVVSESGGAATFPQFRGRRNNSPQWCGRRATTESRRRLRFEHAPHFPADQRLKHHPKSLGASTRKISGSLSCTRLGAVRISSNHRLATSFEGVPAFVGISRSLKFPVGCTSP